jgi:GTP cyclohydrolase I
MELHDENHPPLTELIKGILYQIGEDPNRDGLKDTPKRVAKSYQELFAGYKQDVKSLFTVFDQEGCDSIILLKDIEIFSTCEHHMLPFYGKAHVAYIPSKGKVVGISKLARLVDLYAKRLQIQERICEQVTIALMEHLQPLGAACIIEARHMCMCARGVGKQNSIMTTSSLKGVFLSELSAKQELLTLIK